MAGGFTHLGMTEMGGGLLAVVVLGVGILGLLAVGVLIVSVLKVARASYSKRLARCTVACTRSGRMLNRAATASRGSGT